MVSLVYSVQDDAASSESVTQQGLSPNLGLDAIVIWRERGGT
jgi:hypothetical protein